MTIQELEEWYSGRELPKGPVTPHKSMIIEDTEHFVQTHFYTASAVQTDKAREPILLRLILLKKWMEENGY